MKKSKAPLKNRGMNWRSKAVQREKKMIRNLDKASTNKKAMGLNIKY